MVYLKSRDRVNIEEYLTNAANVPYGNFDFVVNRWSSMDDDELLVCYECEKFTNKFAKGTYASLQKPKPKKKPKKTAES